VVGDSGVVRGGRGHDFVLGESGDETLYAKDSVRDRVWGGRGFDRARVDRGLDEIRSINLFF
jgi:hypothetical protein